MASETFKIMRLNSTHMSSSVSEGNLMARNALAPNGSSFPSLFPFHFNFFAAAAAAAAAAVPPVVIAGLLNN